MHEFDGDHIVEQEHQTLIFKQGQLVQSLPLCEFSPCRDQSHRSKKEDRADGWQTFTSFSLPNNASFSAFLGTFNVPAVPQHTYGQTLFHFTGLQSDDWVPMHAPPFDNVPPSFDIIQPVLQYGSSSAGEVYPWGLSSWYVTVSRGVLFSKLKKVMPGDVIFGNMTRTGPSSFFVGSLSLNTNVATNIEVTKPFLVSQPFAYCTLEVYGVKECSMLASSPIVFSQLQLWDENGVQVKPNWVVRRGGEVPAACNENLVVQSNGTIVITNGN